MLQKVARTPKANASNSAIDYPNSNDLRAHRRRAAWLALFVAVTGIMIALACTWLTRHGLSLLVGFWITDLIARFAAAAAAAAIMLSATWFVESSLERRCVNDRGSPPGQTPRSADN
jgi:hypothetical protein